MFQGFSKETGDLLQQRFPELAIRGHVSRIYRDARRLFGRGPYKDHLWFTLKTGGSRHTEGPVFWFELSAATFSYGLGYFDLSPAEADAFRHSVDVSPARFERLAADAMKMRGFHIIGEEYKRPKKDMGPVINPFYNRKRFGLEHIADFDPEMLESGLPQRLFRAYRRLMPMYEYFFECSSSMPV